MGFRGSKKYSIHSPNGSNCSKVAIEAGLKKSEGVC
jgi:hypothetical protein